MHSLFSDNYFSSQIKLPGHSYAIYLWWVCCILFNFIPFSVCILWIKTYKSLDICRTTPFLNTSFHLPRSLATTLTTSFTSFSNILENCSFASVGAWATSQSSWKSRGSVISVLQVLCTLYLQLVHTTALCKHKGVCPGMSSCLLIHWAHSDTVSCALNITFWPLWSLQAFRLTVSVVQTGESSPDVVLRTTFNRGLRYVLSFAPTSNDWIPVPYPLNQPTSPFSHIWQHYPYWKLRGKYLFSFWTIARLSLITVPLQLYINFISYFLGILLLYMGEEPSMLYYFYRNFCFISVFRDAKDLIYFILFVHSLLNLCFLNCWIVLLGPNHFSTHLKTQLCIIISHFI